MNTCRVSFVPLFAGSLVNKISNAVLIVLFFAPSLLIAGEQAFSKSVGSSSASAGGSVSYSLSGSCSASTGSCGALTVSDSLPSEFASVSCNAPSGFSGSCTLGNISYSKASFEGGDSYSIGITGILRSNVADGTTITNSATASITGGSKSSSATITVGGGGGGATPPAASTSLSKSVTSDTTPLPGSVVNYSLVASCKTNTDYCGRVTITDYLPSPFDSVICSATGGTVALCTTSSIIVNSSGTVQPGSQVSVSVSATLKGTAHGRITNYASASWGNGSAQTASDDIDVGAAPLPITFTKSIVGPYLVEAGEKIRFQLEAICTNSLGCDQVELMDKLDNMPISDVSCIIASGNGVIESCTAGNILAKTAVIQNNQSFILVVDAVIAATAQKGDYIKNNAAVNYAGQRIKHSVVAEVTIRPNGVWNVRPQTSRIVYSHLCTESGQTTTYTASLCSSALKNNTDIESAVFTIKLPHSPYQANVVNMSPGGTTLGNIVKWNAGTIDIAALYAGQSATSEQCIYKTVTVDFPAAAYGVDPVEQAYIVSITGDTPIGGDAIPPPTSYSDASYTAQSCAGFQPPAVILRHNVYQWRVDDWYGCEWCFNYA